LSTVWKSLIARIAAAERSGVASEAQEVEDQSRKRKTEQVFFFFLFLSLIHRI